MSADTVTPQAIDAHVYIEHVRVAGRHRKQLGDLSSLMASIEDLGMLLNPITLTRKCQLIAGQRRLEACRQLGWETVPVRFVDSAEDAAKLLRAERDENTERLDMTVVEKLSLGAALEALERPAALARKGKRTDLANLGVDEPEVIDGGRVDEIVAPAVGMSITTYKRAKAVRQLADDPEADPTVREVAKAAYAAMEVTGNVSGNYAKVREAQARERAHREAQETKASALAAPVMPDELDPLPPRPTNYDAEWIPAHGDNSSAAAVQRRRLLRELASKGNRSSQIADHLGVTEVWVRRAAREDGIPIPADEATARTRRIDSDRIVRETVHALEGLALGVQLVNPTALDPAEIDGWAASMTTSIRALNRLIKQLKETTREA